MGVVALAGTVLPSLPGCGTVLSLIVLFAFWNASPIVAAFLTIALTLLLYALPLVPLLLALRGHSQAIRIGAASVWTAAYLILLLVFPEASDCL
jgi:hypothetical protein